MIFFGELYLRSTRPFLDDAVTTEEARYLEHNLLRRVRGPILDVGCGHGRHLRKLQGKRRPVFGVDFDGLSLEEIVDAAPVVRGDFFHLPFADGAFSGAYSWYNTLFTFEDAQQRPLMREVVRCLKPRGRLVLQTSNKWLAMAQPESRFDGLLPDGTHLFEQCMYSKERSRDELTRRLRFTDGRIMEASFFIRYYDVEEMRELLNDVGLELEWAHGGLDGRPATKESAEIIIGAQKRG